MMQLVLITKKNLPKALKIAYSIFLGKNDRKHIRKWYGISIKSSNPHHSYLKYFIVKQDGKIVGVTGLAKRADNADFWLGWYGVVKEARRQGFGTAILEKTIAHARKLKAKSLKLFTTSKKARKFYEKNKFVKTKKLTWLIINGKKMFRYPSNSVFYEKKIKA